VFRWLSQTIAVLAVGIRTIPQRLSSSAVAIVGIAGVVVVLVSVLSISEGFQKTLVGAGSPSRVIVMRNGSESEMTSGLLGTETDIVKQAPGLATNGARPVAAAEMFVIVDLPKRSTGTSANVPLRGIEPESFQVRDEVKIVDGRLPEFGTNEAVVGRAAMREFKGVDLGSDFRSGNLHLKIVGVFSANGSASESEIWADARILQGAYNRGNSYQAVFARLDSIASFDTVKNWLTTNPQLNVIVKRENDYYAAQTEVMSSLINGIGFVIAFLMAIGAVFSALLTMYSAVATRAREIATLRALGFNTTSVLVSVLGESMALAAFGGAIGALIAYIGFNGYQTATMNFQTFSQVAFAFAVTPRLVIGGLIGALLMGFVGGFFPAVRAARLPISSALREL
jgi:putative ABC transport system permease protein